MLALAYVSSETIKKAKKMDLLTYLTNFEPDELVRLSANVYSTKTHDSLKISNGKWCWFSKGIGGKTALDYLIKVKGLSFLSAVEKITGQTASSPSVSAFKEKKEKYKVLLLPEANNSNARVKEYLLNRGIDNEIIDFCINKGLLYESENYHNAVFIGLDKLGKARYAALRGTVSDFKGECNGSDKRFSFNIPSNGSNTLHLFESAVDVLSFATLLKDENIDWNKDHLLSLAGVYRPKERNGEVRIPLALTQYLKDYPEIDNIVLRLDSDRAGRTAVGSLIKPLSKIRRVTIRFPPKGKDFNDFLCLRKGIPLTRCKSEQRER